MSKFLKFIVHLIIICAIICVLGLTVPPFFGVNTVIIDDAAKKTNLPLGSVTYSIPVRVEDVYVGDNILVSEDSGIYRYSVETLNLDNGTGTVTDPTISSDERITVAVREYVPKIVITIGYVGYLLIATKSTEGIIMLGLGLLFLVILYIIAEIWRKDARSYDDDEEDNVYVKSKRELRREEKERARRMKEEERRIREDGYYDQSREERRTPVQKKKSGKVRTGGFVDEIDLADEAVDDEPVEIRKKAPVQREAAARETVLEARELLKGKEEEETTRRELSAAEEVVRRMTSPEPTEDVYKKDVYEEAPAREPVRTAAPEERIQLVKESPAAAERPKRQIPGYTATELADQARRAGDRPDVVRDQVTEITLFDYSDIIDGVSQTELKDD